MLVLLLEGTSAPTCFQMESTNYMKFSIFLATRSTDTCICIDTFN